MFNGCPLLGSLSATLQAIALIIQGRLALFLAREVMEVIPDAGTDEDGTRPSEGTHFNIESLQCAFQISYFH
jgi:hypothetical protein